MSSDTSPDGQSGKVMTELGDDCVACGSNRIRNRYEIPETMFRTGESFGYRECDVCGSLQIDAVPADLGRHYNPDSYYSFGEPNQKFQRGWLHWKPTRLALRLNTEAYLRTGLGRGFPWARQAGIRPTDKILDLGCGRGENLLLLHLLGYQDLLGADPFLEKSLEVAPGVIVQKAAHEEIDGRFDWVMMHHSFEHIADPRALLSSVHGILADGGRVLVRMPVAGSWAWRKYGVNWGQIDAPRHLVLYTLQAFRDFAEECGFLVDSIFFDSDSFQFFGSELVQSGRPFVGRPTEDFSAEQMNSWAAEAERLNRASDGDQACYVLKPTQR